MKNYMLDTNTASYLVRNYSPEFMAYAQKRLRDQPIMISALTEAELLFGIVRKPEATTLAKSIHTFLESSTILAWDSSAASAYAQLKTDLQRNGLSLESPDIWIAAHSLSVGATLVTSDSAFCKAAHLLKLENWMN